MDHLCRFRGKPYRAAPALGQDRWSIYADDDHRQERYLGTVIEKDGFFYVHLGYERRTLEERAQDLESAIDMLYELCRRSGYLTQGHENYLGGQYEHGENG